MKTNTSALIEKHAQLQAQPYGKRRNAALWRVQQALELRGLFNANGYIRQVTRARTIGGFHSLTAA